MKTPTPPRYNKLLALFCAIAISPAMFAADNGTWANGITEAINDVALSSSLPGIIGKRPVKEGDFVKAGQAVIELDSKLEQLEEQRRREVMELKKTDMDRTKSLLEKSAISVSRDEMDKKVAEYAVSKAEYELAREQLVRRVVVTPFDGTVTALTLNVGEACQAQQPLVRMVDVRKCYFIANVEAKSGYSLKAGQTVKLEIEVGDKMAQFSGTVFFVSPVVDPASGLMRVKVVFDNPDSKVRPGVAGKMLVQEAKDA
jgi:RND family efflux transporter MFP subunit